MNTRRPLYRLAILALAAGAAFGQTAQKKLEFDVASVKVNVANGESDFVPRRSGTRITMHNTQIGSFISYAYHLEGGYQQLAGIPDWPDELRWFDLDARTPPDATDEEVRLMFQSLLADRFKLRVHRETRQRAEYVLTLGKGRLKLTPYSEDGDEPLKMTIEGRSFAQGRGTCSSSLWREGAHLVCRGAAIGEIASRIAGSLRSPVADRTGLTGTYDLDLLFWPENRTAGPDDVTPPALAQALAGIGLKLEKGTGPVEVLVIDHIEQPSEN
jgi:uncharacterized protein (TIGR03435 family)